MFVLSELEDMVEIKASCSKREEEVYNALNQKYNNKLAKELGLCIFVMNISEIVEYEIKNEFLIATARFSAIFLRFFPDEIRYGKIIHQDENKITITDGIFESYECQLLDIFENSEYDAEERAGGWIWNYKGNKLIFQTNDLVLFRIKKFREDDLAVDVYMNEQGLGPLSWWS